ncbi:MAG: hypothetical protein LBI84_07105, partial [Propionibacteriaceae bacterium]|jgi:excinuclease ABC subunit C|nr:hypothetical protein [Propionibacteriaceae bacterium]
LGLAEAPLRIECYDISHLQGQHTVASMVVFEDGLARPSQYRHFLIRTVASNDVGAMREVLSRRFARLRDEEALLRGGGAAEPPPEAKEVLIRPLSTPCPTRGAAELLPEAKEVAAAASVPPVGQAAAPAPTAASPASAALVLPAADDEPGPAAGLIDASTRAPRRFSYAPSLIVVDGAAGQVAAAQAALDGLGVTGVALCGLAKRLEEVWLPGQEFPLILPRASEAMYLLQRLRDEAHRFAIAYHRKRRGQSMVESILDDVSGLGEVRRKALLRRFGSLKKLRAATADEIAQTPGFGPRLAEAVAAAVASRPAGAAVNTATGEIADL